MPNEPDRDELSIPPLRQTRLIRYALGRQRERLQAAFADAQVRLRDAARLRQQRHANVFDHLMACARGIAATDPAGLHLLVTAILRPLQSEQILSVAEHRLHGAHDLVDFEQRLSRKRFFSVFDPNDCHRPPPDDYVLGLGRDIVMTTPWHRTCFEEALSTIGTGRRQGLWRQDPNHRVTLLLPWGFGIVSNGNHSIAAGILAGEGTVTPSEVVDFAPLLARVGSDGRHFRVRTTGKVLAAVRDQRMAALFEIGHMMATTGQAGHRPTISANAATSGPDAT